MPPVPVINQDGAAIKALRLKRGLSRSRLAKQIGRHEYTIANIEREVRRCGDVLFYQIATALDADPEELKKRPVEGSAA